jgi:hypothetical protein
MNNNRKQINEHHYELADRTFGGRTPPEQLRIAEPLLRKLQKVLPKEAEVVIRDDKKVYVVMEPEEGNRPYKELEFRPQGGGQFQSLLWICGEGEKFLWSHLGNADASVIVPWAQKEIAAVDVEALAHVGTKYKSRSEAEDEDAQQDGEWKRWNGERTHMMKNAGIPSSDTYEETFPEYMASMKRETGESLSKYDLAPMKQDAGDEVRPSAYRNLVKKPLDNDDEDLAPAKQKKPSNMSAMVLKENIILPPGVNARKIGPDSWLIDDKTNGVEIKRAKNVYRQVKRFMYDETGHSTLNEGLERLL